jgi:cytidylate kinase
MGIPKLGPVVAIDGPAGTGKSSATRRLADALGFIHVDTGALYRAVAFLSLENKALEAKLRENPAVTQPRVTVEIKAEDVIHVATLARTVHLEFHRMPDKNPANRIFANGRDLTDFIRSPEVSMAASKVSAFPEVRSALLGLQRRLGCAGRAILEGRDIGTVIFPDADVKFFLSASVDERAKRRLVELEATGADAPSFEEVRAQIMERDHGDSTRAVAPLKKAADAIAVDTSTMTLDEVVQSMENTVRARLKLHAS